MPRSRAIVSVEWLAAHLGMPDVQVVDVRWYLPTTGKSAKVAFEDAHLPGATFVDLDHDLAAHGGPGLGRHPLPSAEAFAASLGALGINPETHVVAYDDTGGSTAARMWWMMRQVGHERVSVLDGGIEAWREGGNPVESGRVIAVPTLYPARSFGAFGPIVARGDILPALSAGAILLDARAPERFEGVVEPIDPRAGHVPGARNAPFAGNLVAKTKSGAPRLLGASELHARFAQVGAAGEMPVIVSCGSGVTACHNAFAMYVAGLDVPGIYVGSWSDWSAEPSLPVETGPAPVENG